MTRKLYWSKKYNAVVVLYESWIAGKCYQYASLKFGNSMNLLDKVAGAAFARTEKEIAGGR